MSTVLRTDLEVINARSFIDVLDTVPTLYSRLYLGISRSTVWANEAIPPTPTNSVDDKIGFWDELIALQRIDVTDIRFVVPRINWTSGIEYELFDTASATPYTDNFYIITSNLDVYTVATKTGTNPTVLTEPVGDNGGVPIDTGDGYTWQFLYKIGQTDYSEMMNDNWMIVNWDTSDNTSTQYQFGDVDAYKTLGAKYIMIRSFLDDSGLPVVNTTYRQIGLILDPLTAVDTPLTATNLTIDVGATNILNDSGTLIHLENRTPITRNVGQSETVKLVIEF